jgi:FtsZ-binding cell division protein ZapB
MEEAIKFLITTVVTATLTWIGLQVQKFYDKKKAHKALQEKVDPVIKDVDINRVAIDELKEYNLTQRDYIKNLEGDLKRAEAAMYNQNLIFTAKQETTQEQLEAALLQIQETNTQFQTVMAQNKELIAGVGRIISEVEKLRVKLGEHAALLTEVDEVLNSLRDNAGLEPRKKTTGPLSGKSTDVKEGGK